MCRLYTPAQLHTCLQHVYTPVYFCVDTHVSDADRCVTAQVCRAYTPARCGRHFPTTWYLYVFAGIYLLPTRRQHFRTSRRYFPTIWCLYVLVLLHGTHVYLPVRKDVSHNDVSHKEVSHKEVSHKEVSPKEVSHTHICGHRQTHIWYHVVGRATLSDTPYTFPDNLHTSVRAGDLIQRCYCSRHGAHTSDTLHT